MKLFETKKENNSIRFILLGLPIYYRYEDDFEIRRRFLCFRSKIQKKSKSIEKINKIAKVILNESNKKEIKNSELPDVSVIIPVYNAANFLPSCIRSLLAQDNKNLEFIFIDDCSTDNSLNIIHSMTPISDKRFKIIPLSRNIGVAAARNIGISISKGKYIGFVDPDDTISNNYYSSLYKKGRLTNSDIVMTSKIVKIDLEGSVTGNKYSGVNKDVDNLTLRDRMRIVLTTGVTWNKIYKSDFLKKNLILFPEIKTMGTDNFVTFIAMMQAEKISSISKATYFYRTNPKSIIRKKKDESYFLLTDVYRHISIRLEELPIKGKYKSMWRGILGDRFISDTISNYLGFQSDVLKKEYLTYSERSFAMRSLNVREDIIISLTSYPKRIKNVDKVIKSLLMQNFPFTKINLYLSSNQFQKKDRDLPINLTSLIGDKFEIKWVEEDVRSYKKLIYALQEYPNSIIVTADDDVIYPEDWLKRLITSYLSEPDCIHCLRGRDIKWTKEKPTTYKKWNLIQIPLFSSFRILPTGVGGCLYKRKLLHPDVLNKDLFTKICPDADDMWFWGMAVRNGTKIKIGRPALNKLQLIESSQEDSLWSKNQFDNDKIFNELLISFPEIADKIN